MHGREGSNTLRAAYLPDTTRSCAMLTSTQVMASSWLCSTCSQGVVTVPPTKCHTRSVASREPVTNACLPSHKRGGLRVRV